MHESKTDAVIRLMREDEKKATKRVLLRSFGWFKGVFSVFSPHTFIAVRDNEILGGVIVEIFTLPNGHKTGKVAWIFTAPHARGLKLGQRLTERALEFFSEQGCNEFMAAVEGNNTSSSKLFATRGFDILSPGAQFRRYGVWTFLMWLKMFHYMSPGFFLWARPGDEKPTSASLQWAATLILHLIVLLIFTMRLQRDAVVWLYYCISFAILLGARRIGMHLAAVIVKERVEFRMWESGFPLSFMITIFFGGFFPVPGNVYPREKVWKYKEKTSTLGKIALPGVLTVLVPVLVAWGYIRLYGSPNLLLESIVMIGRIFLIFDLLFFFFPFIGFNGRRVWDWNKFVWVLTSVPALSVIYL